MISIDKKNSDSNIEMVKIENTIQKATTIKAASKIEMHTICDFLPINTNNIAKA